MGLAGGGSGGLGSRRRAGGRTGRGTRRPAEGVRSCLVFFHAFRTTNCLRRACVFSLFSSIARAFRFDQLCVGVFFLLLLFGGGAPAECRGDVTAKD